MEAGILCAGLGAGRLRGPWSGASGAAPRTAPNAQYWCALVGLPTNARYVFRTSCSWGVDLEQFLALPLSAQVSRPMFFRRPAARWSCLAPVPWWSRRLWGGGVMGPGLPLLHHSGLLLLHSGSRLLLLHLWLFSLTRHTLCCCLPSLPQSHG